MTDKYGLKVTTKSHPYNNELTKLILEKRVFKFITINKCKVSIKWLSISDLDVLIEKLQKIRANFY